MILFSLGPNASKKGLKVLGKSVGLCKTTKRRDYCTSVYLSLYGESSVKISTQTKKKKKAEI